MNSPEAHSGLRCSRSPGLCWAALAVAYGLIGAAVFAPVWGGHFQSDDYLLMDLVRRGGPWAPWRFPGFDQGAFFRPLVTASMWFDGRLWGLWAGGYHLTNGALHWVASLLVAAVVASLGAGAMTARRAWWCGAMAGALFLLHPAHGEAVAWISGRTDLIATVAALASLLSYFHARRLSGQGRRREAACLWAVAVVLFGAGLLAKESVVTLPLIVLAWEALLRDPQRKDSESSRWLPPLALFAVLGAYGAIRCAALGAAWGGYGHARSINAAAWIKHGVADGVRSLLPYLPESAIGMLPGGLARWVGQYGVGALIGITAVALAASVWMWARRGWRSDPRLVFFLAAWGLAVLPVIPLGVSLRSPQGERFLYWPTALTVGGVAWLLMKIPVSRKTVAALFAVILIVYGVVVNRSAALQARASHLALSIIESIEPVPPQGRLVILNVPDHLAGAYVLRNGLAEALGLTRGMDPARIRVGLRQELASESSTVRAIHEGTHLQLVLEDPAELFTAPPETERAAMAEPMGWMRAFSSREALFDLPPLGTDERVIFYSAGRMHEAAR